jgi:hypothetical protein
MEIEAAPIEPPQIGCKKPLPQTKRFAAVTADKTGETKSAIKIPISRGKTLERAAMHLLDLHGTQAEGVARRRAKAIDPEHQDDLAKHWLQIAERVRELSNQMLRGANGRKG